MKGFLYYLRIQIKRTGKLLPILQLGMLLLGLTLGIGAVLLMLNGDYGKGQTRFEVGIVGNTEDTYMDFGIRTIQSLDSSHLMVNLQTMTEEAARRALEGHKLSCYVRIPDGLVDSLVYGRNDRCVEIVTSYGDDIFSGLAVELADLVSTLCQSSQSAVFGMQQVLYKQGMADQVGSSTDALNMRFFDIILNRMELCEMEILGIQSGISATGYYVCALPVFFLMLSGIVGSLLFARRNRELCSMMAARGLGAFRQVLGEYLAYVPVNLLCMTEAVLMAGILWKTDILEINEWRRAGMEALAHLWLLLLPVSLMLSALHFLLYELISGVVNSVLIQFLCSIVMGYLGGCFYPYPFFPDILQKTGGSLPVGAAVRYVQDGVTGGASAAAGCGIAVYLAIFLGLSAVERKRRTERGR